MMMNEGQRSWSNKTKLLPAASTDIPYLSTKIQLDQ